MSNAFKQQSDPDSYRDRLANRLDFPADRQAGLVLSSLRKKELKT